MKVTIAVMLTPKGENLNGTGVTPDVDVKLTTEDILQGKDGQMEKAFEVLVSKVSPQT